MLTRRDTLAIGLGASAVAMLPVAAAATPVDDAIAAYTGGAAIAEGGVTITAPEIAENGNTVPITIEAPGAVEIMLIATGNPTPNVGKFTFGPGSGAPMIATRMRLGRTQDVLAIAKMEDGSFASTAVEVKVTIGGCGG
ncbi:thiosulfate oxidation carrier protein SoxY [Pararhodobacter zhoushanensis]|uniref:Thiosulfate oxidation carrier protein SoxY n=1 Tax=Pararhodobacter zhoushanensis TaxID=2479545 RepID=A0ABT3H0R2_9RHOB|nr:thiosulfate oxidation carrier protein SoxY [Pararhodobacter zhoushanensis]MCW1933387.1 thiosulfate oxidation carrier protein SoxY [Pararhodobacter zhoushanensis]